MAFYQEKDKYAADSCQKKFEKHLSNLLLQIEKGHKTQRCVYQKLSVEKCIILTKCFKILNTFVGFQSNATKNVSSKKVHGGLHGYASQLSTIFEVNRIAKKSYQIGSNFEENETVETS